ncbi:MAG: DNA repair protein RecO [Negativicutes bacterium]|nr:DNA repair protein RecO [Negativicutes bacterium]
MAEYQTEAILLAARDYGGADRMVTLFSSEYGKISAIAYGARNAKNRLAGALQPFTHMDVSLAFGKAIDTVRQCEIKQSFRELREDLIFMAYASFIAEIVVEFWPEREPEPGVFELLLGAFALLSRRNPRIVALAAGWQLMALAGFAPQLEQCAVCGDPLKTPAAFSAQAGGVVCPRCQGSDTIIFSGANKIFLTQLLALSWDSPGHFTVNSGVLASTENLLNVFLACRMEKPLKSLAFIRLVNASDRI